MRAALAFLLSLTCGPGLTSAASFDCSKAASPVERLVCEDPQLSQLDEKLAAAYQAKTLTTSDSNSVREQRQWLARRNRCPDRVCVRTAYEERLAQLAACTATPTVSAVSAHGAILAADCTVWMWGFNNAGQLGRKPAGSEPKGFTQIKGIPPMVGVVVAHDHTVGIASDRRPYIWGSEEYLRCGGDYHPYNSRLMPVTGLPKVSAVDDNGRLVALLTEAGEVFQLGCVDREAYSIAEHPVRVEGLPRIAALAVGGSHRLALSEAGEVWSWGERDPCIRTPGEHRAEAQPPAKVASLPKIVAVSAGSWHAMALDVSGTVWVWGSNQDWQLGIQGSICESSPVPLAGLPPIKAIATGWFESAALTEAGKVLFWGNRTGRGFTEPALIANLDEVMSVSLGGNSGVTSGVFVIRRNGDVLKWLPDERPNYSIPTRTAPGRISSFPDPSGPPFNAYRRQR